MKLTIFKSIADVKEYITVDISSDYSVIAPYINQAEKYVRDITGDALFDLLITYVQSSGTEPELEALLPYCQLPLANFGYLLGVAKLNVNVGNTGITVTSTQNLTPANEWRIKDLKESLELSGNDALEQLIKFLENNKADYPTWESSDAYSFQRNFFVDNATDFFETIYKKITRMEYLIIREYLVLAEVDVKEAVCKELFDELKTQVLADTVTADNEILLTYIKPAVCYFSLGKLHKQEGYSIENKKLIKQLRDFLGANASATKYPLYFNSDCYEEIISSEFNDEESGIYCFGL